MLSIIHGGAFSTSYLLGPHVELKNWTNVLKLMNEVSSVGARSHHQLVKVIET